jgi:hypothetical protein
MSYTPPFEITSKILNLVSEISEAIGKLEVLTLFCPQKCPQKKERKKSSL